MIIRTPLCLIGLCLAPTSLHAQDVDDLVARCGRGDAAACTEAGKQYQWPGKPYRDLTQSLTYYQRGCDGGDGAGLSRRRVS